MGVGLTVRPIAEADFAAVSALLAELGRPAVTVDKEEAAQAVFRRHVAAPDTASLLAERDGVPVGFLSLHFRERLNHFTPDAWIPDLIVTEREWGGGAARPLRPRRRTGPRAGLPPIGAGIGLPPPARPSLLPAGGHDRRGQVFRHAAVTAAKRRRGLATTCPTTPHPSPFSPWRR